MNPEIKRLSADDIDEFIELIRLFERVFEMENFVMPGKQHLQHLLNQATFYVFTAVLEGKIIGGVTAYTVTQYYSTQDAVYLFDLAVDASVQRQGVGRKLMNALNNHCRDKGVEVVFLEADEEDLHAQEFYRSTGAVEEKVYFYSYPLKTIPRKQDG
jgi:ribosomal protein S18 acetylase RimI-like enzyme